MCHWRVPEKLHSQQALSPRRSHCPHGRQTPTLPSAPTAYVFILTCYIFVYFQIDINGTISFASFCGGWDWLLSLDTMLRFIHVVCSPRPFIFIAVYYSLAQIYTSYLSILLSMDFELAPVFSAAAAAKSLQSCLTLCDPIDGSPPGSSVHGILQARVLEWGAIAFSNAWKWKVKVKSLSRVQLLVIPWTAAHQAPPSMGFSRQEYWSGLPLSSPMCP